MANRIRLCIKNTLGKPRREYITGLLKSNHSVLLEKIYLRSDRKFSDKHPDRTRDLSQTASRVYTYDAINLGETIFKLICIPYFLIKYKQYNRYLKTEWRQTGAVRERCGRKILKRLKI